MSASSHGACVGSSAVFRGISDFHRYFYRTNPTTGRSVAFVAFVGARVFAVHATAATVSGDRRDAGQPTEMTLPSRSSDHLAAPTTRTWLSVSNVKELSGFFTGLMSVAMARQQAIDWM